jgi:hypothetical protein
MAIAIVSLSALSLLALANAAAAPIRSAPPIGITVTTAPHVSERLVTMILAETDAIWRPAGLTFAWQRGVSSATPTMLRVTIDDQQRPPTRGDLALGWIVFNDGSSPEPSIHLSYASAFEYMTKARGVVGFVERMPVLERDTYMARALGRALAHELGHYLLASKTHTSDGLMSTRRSATELFGSSRHRFAISPAERATVAARLDPTVVMGSR